MPTSPESITALNFTPIQPLHPSPRDWRDQCIYFLLVDRFDDNTTRPAYAPNAPHAALDPAQGSVFQGGNIKGITRRLDYIKNLGCTTLWLSPIFKNRQDQNDAYHGYGVQDFLEVDPRYGTMADLQELSREAHSRGMYVVQDIIFNHTGDVWGYPGNFPYYYDQGQQFEFSHWRELDPAPGLQRDDGIWPQELQNPDVFKRKGQIRNWNNTVEAQDGDFLSLKELDIKRPEVLNTLIQAYKYWIRNADIDGFRIDTVKHMENQAVALFCNAIREYAQRIGKHNFFMFGEIVDDDATIQKYIGRNTRLEHTNERFPSLDAALDFPLYFILEEVIKGFLPPDVLRMRYEAFRSQYTDHGAASRYFVTFIDNHDQMARKYRRFMHQNPYPQQCVLAIAYLLTSLGVPCIYYGTEQGFDGGGDHDSYVRECMFGGNWGAFHTANAHFFNEQHAIYQGIQAIAELRQQLAPLRYGRQYFRQISGDGANFSYPQDGRCTLAYSRILDTEEIVVLLNLDRQSRNDCITVDRSLNHSGQQMRNLLQAGALYDIQQTPDARSYVRVALKPHEVAILAAHA